MEKAQCFLSCRCARPPAKACAFQTGGRTCEFHRITFRTTFRQYQCKGAMPNIAGPQCIHRFHRPDRHPPAVLAIIHMYRFRAIGDAKPRIRSTAHLGQCRIRNRRFAREISAHERRKATWVAARINVSPSMALSASSTACIPALRARLNAASAPCGQRLSASTALISGSRGSSSQDPDDGRVVSRKLTINRSPAASTNTEDTDDRCPG